MKALLTCILIFITTTLIFANNFEQDKVVECHDVELPPVINGNANDACWDKATWQAIDQTWIPWGQIIDAADFTGRYKTVWSSAENLMYFIVEITDDVISDAYVKGQTADIYNFDMIEVFIDQDKSGGGHIFDDGTNNAENAFAYHIFAKIPESGKTSNDYYVTDIAGTGWNNRKDPSYVDHLPEFAIARIDQVTTYEFSLIVYNDTYSESNKESARVKLKPNTEMGLSLAANDDDQPEVDPSKTERDNMIGSVAVKKENNNDHWMLANDFGTVKLLSDSQSSVDIMKVNTYQIELYPNPASNKLIVKTINKINLLNIYSLSGQLIETYQNTNSNVETINIDHIKAGCYLLKVYTDTETYNNRFIIR